MRLVLGIEFGIGLAAAAVFVAGYLRVPGWWRTEAGKHMMSFTAILGMLFGLLLVGRLVGGLPGLVWVLALGVLDGLLIWRVFLLIHAQRRQK